ncbi:hypothetical protein D0C36_21675 [Mucilaginibacter conchicola]|uniref:Uncharacterized protein n=1 Tax=Mucilaginibacter conchicola TaxID=2303333 RepID=A0A372NPV3_9SPHI|nr:hypothetical protein [Mucilaginibacter conchicola]RFZ90405.1 hypothetical protein D0C36_21675 [Mucilaginibacter conchicola]
MKKLLAITALLLLKFSSVYCQSNFKVDSIYYILPENKNDKDSSILNFDSDEHMVYTTLQSVHLKNGEKPFVSYSLKDEKTYLSSIKLKKLNIVSSSELMLKCREVLNENKIEQYRFFFLEKVAERKYLIHTIKVRQTQTVN